MMMQTPFGNRFDLINPTIDQIDSIEEIAFALSGINRFAGATSYTVAEHSLWISEQTSNNELKLYALLHDAHEAYMGDIPSPVAEVIGKEEVRGLKERIQKVILDKFNIPYRDKSDPVMQWIENMDLISLLIEKRDLLINRHFKWNLEGFYDISNYETIVIESDKRQVMGKFLKAFYATIS